MPPRSDLVNVASKTGIPPVRALFLAFPDDEAAHDHADDQFMVGEALLVAPVIEQGASSRSVRSSPLWRPSCVSSSLAHALLCGLHGVGLTWWLPHAIRKWPLTAWRCL